MRTSTCSHSISTLPFLQYLWKNTPSDLFVYSPAILTSFLKHPFSPLYWIISINIQTAYQIYLQSKTKEYSPDSPLPLPAAAISLFPLQQTSWRKYAHCLQFFYFHSFLNLFQTSFCQGH